MGICVQGHSILVGDDKLFAHDCSIYVSEIVEFFSSPIMIQRTEVTLNVPTANHTLVNQSNPKQAN